MKYPPEQQPPAAPVAPMFDGTQACAGADILLFFPPRGELSKHTDRAKALCDACRFLTPCFQYAMTTPAGDHGVWGHTTAGERRAIRRRGQSPSLFFRAAS